MEISLSPLVEELKESATLAINQTALGLRKSGQEVFHFGFGQSPFPVPHNIQQALKDATSHKEYLPTRGLDELHEKFVKYYNEKYNTNFQSKYIFVGPGSKELLFQALYLIWGPLIVPAPSWVSYGPQAHLCRKNIVPVVTQKENGYKITPDELQKCCDDLGPYVKQKIIILNTPNNPSGAVYNREEATALVEVLRKNNVVVLSDEIYALVDFDGDHFVSFAELYPEGTIVSTGLSKGFSAGGYRVGIMALPENMANVSEALKVMISETFSAVSSPTQYAALAAFTTEDKDQEHFIDGCCQIHTMASTYIHERLIKMGIGCVKPDGAFYLFPDFDDLSDKLHAKGIKDSVELCAYLLKNYNVAILPGVHFYMPAERFCARMASVDYDGEQAINAFLAGEPLNFEFIQNHLPNIIGGCDALERFVGDL